MQSCAILPFAMGSPCQEMSRDHVIAVIAWLLCQWLQARRELQPYAPQILTLETKLTSTSVACMPGACLVHAWCMPGACLVHAWCMPGAKLQDVATGFILVASAKGRFANNHLVPQVQPSQGVAWSRTKTIFNENIYVANGCKWMHMNTFPSIPLHLHYTSLHYIRKNGSESWLHRGAAAHPSPTCPNFHCDLLHESFLGPGSLVYRRRWPWTASSYYVDLCGMVQ